MQEVVKSEAFVGINGESWGCVIEGECGSEAILHVGCDPHALTTIRCEPRVALSAAHLSVKNDTLAFREERAPEPGPWQLPLRWAKEGYDINAQFQKSEFRSSSKKQVIMPPAIDCVVDVS
jgi:hypothetical protein